MAGGWVEIVSDLICILASVCVCALLTHPTCNYAISWWTYCCYSWRMWVCITTKTSRQPKKTRLFSECLVWSSCLVLFSFLHLFFAFVGLTSRKHNNSRCLGVSWTRDTGPCIIHFYIHMDNLYIYICIHTYIHTSRQAGRQADRQTDW